MLQKNHFQFQKRYLKCSLFYSFLIFFLNSCEEVINVELLEAETRLVVNGLVRVDPRQEFVPIEIRVTETSNFFDENTVTQLESAEILVGESDPDDPFSTSFGVIVLNEMEPNSGIYIANGGLRTEFLTRNTEFFLIIEHKGKRYAAQTFYQSTVPIENIEQEDGVSNNNEEVELKITITDVPEEKNYYVFDFGEGEFATLDDQFINGQKFEFSFFPERNLNEGEELEVSILGSDQGFFNYIDLLVEQTENDEGVFETPSATTRGNVFDVTGLDNIEIFDNVGRPDEFALGYFAVVEEFKSSIIIE